MKLEVGGQIEAPGTCGLHAGKLACIPGALANTHIV